MPELLAAAAFTVGAGAALFYARQGLTLSHYDAKAHLVVARRVLDSVTPEYSQIGAVWLPLPHLLNLLPVQIDAFYRNGASAVAISVLSFALACYAMSRLVLRTTGSATAAALSVTIFALDPDVLYLQSTPMTEPLLFGLTLLAVSLVHDWIELRPDEAALSPDVMKARSRAAWALVLACLTRYEAWVVTAGLLVLAPLALWRHGVPAAAALKESAELAVYPVLAIVGFFFHSWFTTGAWFVTGGFFVPDNVAHNDPVAALLAVVYGMRVLIGRPFVLIALAGLVVLVVRGLTMRDQAPSLVLLALAALLVLPAYAFFQGHPFRMRYSIAPAVGAMTFVGIAVGSLGGRLRLVVSVAAIVWIVAAARPLDAQAPMVQEAQWDVPLSRGRRNVTACLMREYRGEPILVSMGSLAHYMQELSREGLEIRDFIHEGNLPHWQQAIDSPQGRVGWILVEERAEGGDMLAARTRASSAFLTGFKRVCADGGVALYKAD